MSLINPGTIPFGMQVIVSPHVVQRRPLFPDKRRTKRGIRRTLARYGRLYRLVPAALTIGGKLVVHPEIYAELKREVAHA